MSNFIVQVALDVWYESLYPAMALVGDLYKINYSDIKETPFRNMPKEIRDSNPEFKYQPLYEVSSTTIPMRVIIGDNIFGVATNNYISWNEFILEAEKVFNVLFNTNKSGLKITRVGIRYIDFIENCNLFLENHIKIEVSKEFKNNSNALNLRFENKVENTIIVENIIYPFQKHKSEELFGTYIDIITAQEQLCLEGNTLLDSFKSIAFDLHDKNKLQFKKMLTHELRRQIAL